MEGHVDFEATFVDGSRSEFTAKVERVNFEIPSYLY